MKIAIINYMGETMKKSIFITVILFLFSTILQMLLNFIINEQIISRILYGVDYNTYFSNYYTGESRTIRVNFRK